MEDTGNSIIAAFDSLFTTNKIQMLKILLPRLSPSSQGSFAVYIKFLELRHAMRFARSHTRIMPERGKPLSFNLSDTDHTDTIQLLDELLPFSSGDERKKIEGFKNLLNNMSRIREMMDMIQMMQELFPEGFSFGGSENGGENSDGDESGDGEGSGNNNGGGMNPFDILSGLSGMTGMGDTDLSALFEMFGGKQS